MAKSFYDLDYIIEINEKRFTEYTALYQKVFERLTNVILIYSGLGIFLVPLSQHVVSTDIKGALYYILFVAFAVLLLISLVYFIRLLLPVDVAYLDPPKKYYLLFRDQLEQLYMDEQQTIDESLKSSYVIDLESAIRINERLFRQKSSFFYNALVFALLAVVPYIACMGYHLSARSDGVEKTAAVKEKILNFK